MSIWHLKPRYSEGRRALPKNWWWWSVDTLTPFFQLVLIYFFYLISPNDPLFNNSQPIFGNFLQNDPLFRKHFVKFSLFFQIFVKNVSKFICCTKNLPKFVLLSSFDCPPPYFLSSHWMTPPFWRKSLTGRPMVLSCCPSTPVTSKVKCSPLLP